MLQFKSSWDGDGGNGEMEEMEEMSDTWALTNKDMNACTYNVRTMNFLQINSLMIMLCAII